MRILFCGDVMGRAGREVVVAHLPRLRRDLRLDFVVINGENSAHGFGITEEICREFYAAGCDVVTGGNHSWDKKEIVPYIAGDPRLLRPENFPPGTPGNGHGIYKVSDGRTILVINAMGRLFMDAIDDPFRAVDGLLKQHPLGTVDAILVDFHGEATSEKVAIGVFCDSRASAVVGSHTHVPTADHRILPGGTAFQTDTGMCGDYDSVIGIKKETVVARFVTKLPGERMQVAEGEGTLCGVFIATDDATGLATDIAPVRVGGKLAPAMPRLAAKSVPAL
ncbi:MAG TPA: TIGR00282 family metallophosphoesterase [Stellaceae bacterium]|nr:TIGR00282 family metallophosphoesterase [Stellaceae bacterium]